jgi:hypothetical protein
MSGSQSVQVVHFSSAFYTHTTSSRGLNYFYLALVLFFKYSPNGKKVV